MPASKDPTDALRQAAAALPNIIKGTSCNQTSFKVGKKAVLYVGPGAKGVGFKTMFKLSASLEEARELANADPDRFEVGSGNWVTVRFSTEKPLPKKIWGKWLKESHAERWLVGNRRNLRRESRTHFKPADGDFDQRFVACRLIATGFRSSLWSIELSANLCATDRNEREAILSGATSHPPSTDQSAS